MTPRSKKAPARSNAGGTAAARQPRRPEAATRSDAEPTTAARPAHRPPAAGVTRDALLRVRVTDAELATIRHASGGDVSCWVRRVLLEAAQQANRLRPPLLNAVWGDELEDVRVLLELDQ